MIHFTKEGDRKKVGLNLYRTRGGFVVAWVWYYPATHELKCWRFRLRMHIKPRILWSVDSCNVISNYLTIHDHQLVNREVLVDLVASGNEGSMTKEELIDMAREAGARQMVSSLTHPNGPVTALKFDLDSESIKAFAKLVAEKAIKEALAQPTSGDYALGYSIGFGEGHSAGKALAQPEQELVAWEQFYPDIGKPKFVAQPEQEPAAWRRKRFSPELGEYFEYKRRIFSKETDGEDWTPLYTTPQPKQEPVGYVSEGEPDRLIAQKQTHTPVRNYRLFTHDVPLYTTPHTKVGCVECKVSGGHAFYCVACAKNLFGGYKK